jgi:hypothetical protein
MSNNKTPTTDPMMLPVVKIAFAVNLNNINYVLSVIFRNTTSSYMEPVYIGFLGTYSRQLPVIAAFVWSGTVTVYLQLHRFM